MPKLVPIDPPSTHRRKRTTQLARANRVRDVAVKLAKGLVRAEIVPSLMIAYDISRSTANRLVDDAMQQRERDSQCHWIEDDVPLSIDDNQPLLIETRGLMFKAASAFDETLDPALANAFCKLGSTYEKLFRMGGRFTESMSHKD